MTRISLVYRMVSNVSKDYSRALPCFVEGKVCKGFGRGSKELGVPTANFDHQVVDKLPKDLDCGIYYGMASINGGTVRKAVLSVGWNPFYQNDKKSLETHILHHSGGDFYGANLKLVILGHIRPERDFLSLEDLISEIQNDIRIADEKLDSNEYLKYKTDSYFDATNYESNGT